MPDQPIACMNLVEGSFDGTQPHPLDAIGGGIAGGLGNISGGDRKHGKVGGVGFAGFLLCLHPGFTIGPTHQDRDVGDPLAGLIQEINKNVVASLRFGFIVPTRFAQAPVADAGGHLRFDQAGAPFRQTGVPRNG